MSDNVVALPGFSVPNGEAVKEVVEILEEALDKARAGKLQGVAVVMAERSPDAFELLYHAAGSRHTLAAGALALCWRFGKAMGDGGD